MPLRPALTGGAGAAAGIAFAAPVAGSGRDDVEEHDGRKYRWTGPAPMRSRTIAR
jgi:hypothetical protein